MKKTLLTACSLLIACISFGQTVSIGIKGGLNLSKITSNDGGGNYSTGTLTTFNAGAFVDINFGNFSIQPALNYTGEGGTESLDSPTAYYPGEPSSSSSEAKVHLYYLQLPVNLVYHIPVAIGNFYFGAGPYVAEGLSGKTTYTNSSESQKINFGSADADVRPTQFGADAIVGFKLKNGFLINANYNLGLSNDLPSSEKNIGSSKSRVFGISIGYVFL